MQKRFHIGWFSTFQAAMLAKNDEKETKPDGHFQIRKKSKGFELVERLHTKEAEHVQDYLQGKSRKHPKRAKRFRNENP